MTVVRQNKGNVFEHPVIDCITVHYIVSIKDDKNGQGIWHAWHRREMHAEFGSKTTRKDLGIDGRIILKCVLK